MIVGIFEWDYIKLEIVHKHILYVRLVSNRNMKPI